MYLIRHGETSYNNIDIYKNCSYMNFLPLSNVGIKNSKKLLEKIDATEKTIVSSPYTCALQTAYILANGKCDVIVERNLHNWLPDKQFGLYIHQISSAHQEYENNNGKHFNDSIYNYETKEELKTRFMNCIEKYTEQYNSDDLIFVCHKKLIETVIDKEIQHCKIYEI